MHIQAKGVGNVSDVREQILWLRCEICDDMRLKAADTMESLLTRNEVLEKVLAAVLAFQNEPESSERFEILHNELDEAIADCNTEQGN